jgi:hypothetical protein
MKKIILILILDIVLIGCKEDTVALCPTIYTIFSNTTFAINWILV